MTASVIDQRAGAWLDIVETRHSVHCSEAGPLASKLLDRWLCSASWAPSAHDPQPWRFALVETFARKGRLVSILAGAPMAIAAIFGTEIQCKIAVVLDEDVDIFNLPEMMGGATRTRAEGDHAQGRRLRRAPSFLMQRACYDLARLPLPQANPVEQRLANMVLRIGR